VLNTVPRGEVTYKARAKQERDFTGLRYGNITPTDIDGLIEYKNKCYVFYEAKYVTAPPMSDGQRVAFERLCDDLQKIKPTLLISFEHSFPADKAIDFANCDVQSYRYNGEWKKPNKAVSVKRMSDRFIERFGV
jgi:hypothetical protein